MEFEQEKRLLRFVTEAFAILISLYLLQRLLTPKYVETFPEGSLTAEWYEYEHDHDVLFVGDCEIYTAFSCPFLWEKYGINSCSRAGIQQTVWQTYYLLTEMLEEEQPKAVVFNVMAMRHGENESSAYNHLNLDGMKWSWEKLCAVRSSLMEGESVLEFFFPLLSYHDRWDQLIPEDFQYFLEKERVSYNGYLLHTEILPYKRRNESTDQYGGALPERCWEYLERMRMLCEKKDIQFILVKGPGIYPEWYIDWDDSIKAYVAAHELLYINFLELASELEIDYSLDTFSAGKHMNVTGAEKVSAYMGEILREECGIPDRRDEKKLDVRWRKMLSEYEKEKGDYK